MHTPSGLGRYTCVLYMRTVCVCPRAHIYVKGCNRVLLYSMVASDALATRSIGHIPQFNCVTLWSRATLVPLCDQAYTLHPFALIYCRSVYEGYSLSLYRAQGKPGSSRQSFSLIYSPFPRLVYNDVSHTHILSVCDIIESNKLKRIDEKL